MTDNAPRIHPTAVIDPAARLADDVQVGAFTLIHSGFLGMAVSGRCAFSGWRGRGSLAAWSNTVVIGLFLSPFGLENPPRPRGFFLPPRKFLG